MGVAESIFGLAYGDAVGKPTEFMQPWMIKRKYGKAGIRELPRPAIVTDDTQMALEVGEALVRAALETPGYLTYDAFADELTASFVAWDKYVEGFRAPGSACRRATGRLARGLPWWEATDVKTKGCGANMRVTPIGCAAWLTSEERAGLAQLQSAFTHAHPTALAASDATQQAVWLLLNGCAPEDLVETLIDYCDDQRGVYHEKWLGLLYTWDDAKTGTEFMQRGWDQTQKALLNVMNATYRPSRKLDPCLLTGDGWIAEEALATALHCFLLYPENGPAAVFRAANTRGDSDSLAALAGAFAGAHLGPGCWPADWRNRIEYPGRLAKLVHDLTV